VTLSQPAPASPPGPRGLADGLIILAGTADDDSVIGPQLTAITRLAADRLTAVAFASVTRATDAGYTTVAVSSELAMAVDEAQYADDRGPCLDALDDGVPTVMPDIDATMSWPGFRQAAHRLGLRTSLSIPLFAGRGLPVAALNLYGHDPAAMAPLSAAVLAAYDDAPEEDRPAGDHDDLCPGARELIEGLLGAFAVRATIQQAIGMVIAQRHTSADVAYAHLRSTAAVSAIPLIDVATTVVGAGR
jgi:hypothetical protein